VIDTVAFTRTDSLSPGVVLRGTVRLEGYRDAPDMPGAHPRQIAVRGLAGTFEAPFDPRPAPTPNTMTLALQKQILQQALDNFSHGERWSSRSAIGRFAWTVRTWSIC
jgi:hypothetical protein